MPHLVQEPLLNDFRDSCQWRFGEVLGVDADVILDFDQHKHAAHEMLRGLAAVAAAGAAAVSAGAGLATAVAAAPWCPT